MTSEISMKGLFVRIGSGSLILRDYLAVKSYHHAGIQAECESAGKTGSLLSTRTRWQSRQLLTKVLAILAAKQQVAAGETGSVVAGKCHNLA